MSYNHYTTLYLDIMILAKNVYTTDDVESFKRSK